MSSLDPILSLNKILVKSSLIQLKSYLILEILPEPISVNLAIKAKKIYMICKFYILHISVEISPLKYIYL